MDNTIIGDAANPIIGIPYNNINWQDISGQPFGLASQFNLFVFGDANNIVDVEGAMAVGGSFYSPRSLSVGFQREKGQVPIKFSPDLVRFLAGNIVSMKGPLVVIGNAVSGGSFNASLGSTYYVGKDGTNNQIEDLKYLYQANGGSSYWTPSDKGDYYIISSYDVPRIIKASVMPANLPKFFQDARRSISAFKNCIMELNANGSVTSNSYEWVLTGNDPRQNVFTIDARPNGLLNKGIRFKIPQGSIAIVRIKTGPHAHLQYGLYGEERLANHILYVFEDATDIHMEKSSDIWGSILAPQAMFHGHLTGGRVGGTAVLGGFAVNANSGFEFHLYPFVGGVICMNQVPIPEIPIEVPLSEIPIEVPLPVVPAPVISPEPVPCPPCPEVPPCPEPIPCPPCPEMVPCPELVPCPEVTPCPEVPPCPTCPEPTPCPACPEAPPCPTCPEPTPCPACPEAPPCPACPEPTPCPPCPKPQPCPECPPCPKCPEQKQEKIYIRRETEYVAVPVPIPIPMETEPQTAGPVYGEGFITEGVIAGCVFGCDCCRIHDWEVKLYQMSEGKKKLLYCITICHMGCFRFEVDYNGAYILKICPTKRNCFNQACRPRISFKNVGVADFTIE
jgi:choice-of-anchor A domain-containing protein